MSGPITDFMVNALITIFGIVLAIVIIIIIFLRND